ncbi:phage tail protein, partial [Salmonella enterica subsp. diarizonae]|nr:phage tail protein [Salmonella enterica subsp. diarizonae]
ADDLIQLNQEIAFAMVMQGLKIHERQQKMKQDIEVLTRVNDILDYSVGWSE